METIYTHELTMEDFEVLEARRELESAGWPGAEGCMFDTAPNAE